MKKIGPYNLVFLGITDKLFIKACAANFRHAKTRYIQNLDQIQYRMLTVNQILSEQMQTMREEISNVAGLNYIFHSYVMLDFKLLYYLLSTPVYSVTLYCMSSIPRFSLLLCLSCIIVGWLSFVGELSPYQFFIIYHIVTSLP